MNVPGVTGTGAEGAENSSKGDRHGASDGSGVVGPGGMPPRTGNRTCSTASERGGLEDCRGDVLNAESHAAAAASSFHKRRLFVSFAHVGSFLLKGAAPNPCERVRSRRPAAWPSAAEGGAWADAAARFPSGRPGGAKASKDERAAPEEGFDG